MLNPQASNPPKREEDSGYIDASDTYLLIPAEVVFS